MWKLILTEKYKLFQFRFKFQPVPNVNQYEIHTEVYVFGHIFTFAYNDGIRMKEISSSELYKLSNGDFGQQSQMDQLIGNAILVSYKYR